MGFVDFIEFRNNDLLQNTIQTKKDNQPIHHDYLDTSFHLIEQLYHHAYEYFDKQDLKMICEKLTKCKKIAIITTVYGYTSSVYFANLMNPYGIKVYIINRDRDDYSIQELYKKRI